MNRDSIAKVAMRTFLAQKSPSVIKVNLKSILEYENALNKGEDGVYVGIKDSHTIPSSFIHFLKQNEWIIHTTDKASISGRAIDIELINPITGRHMTGSSSGSAINVFLGINDLGIGTDGGGSVLAPALSLNLFGLISPLYYQEELKSFSKKSTDQIEFTPSLGFISKNIELIEKLHTQLLGKSKSFKELEIVVAKKEETSFPIQNVKQTTLSYDSLDRKKMLLEIADFDFENQLLVTEEGPIDTLAYGDSVIGHYDETTASFQALSGKYYIKVINMSGKSAIVIPNGKLACGWCVICKSSPTHIQQAIELAKKLEVPRSELEQRYFTVENFI